MFTVKPFPSPETNEDALVIGLFEGAAWPERMMPALVGGWPSCKRKATFPRNGGAFPSSILFCPLERGDCILSGLANKRS
ncbi:hypothetical protein EP10_002128 [Geobacillus icigianus]|uniref:Uncharacterized protein n=1 Tax=Geobacillus icigianus TaxID=1430331 RepID=A0ABU6BH71_9BACL|nr:hypothetical protein [Geobacillus icigianus]